MSEVKARFYTKKEFKKTLKMKDGNLIVRVIPPLNELFSTPEFSNENRWETKQRIQYGYKTSDGKHKPFVSPEVFNFNTKMVEVEDAANERIKKFKAELIKAQEADNEPLVEKLKGLVGFDGIYNLDVNHYLNVVDQQGNVQLLAIRPKCYEKLDAKLKAWHKEGVDPFSVDNGRWLVFNRTGTGLNTNFDVSILKEKLEVEKVGTVERDVVHSMDENLKNRIQKEARKLGNLFPRFTAEQVKMIVDQSDLMTGVSTYLDTLYNQSSTADTPEEDDVDMAPAVTSAAAVTPTVKPAVVAPVAPVITSTPKVTPKVTPVKTVTEMSNDEFMKMLETGSL